MKISVTSEAIVKSQAEMEPRWSIQGINIIVEDGLLKQYLLNRLCISQSCLLRADYYHVMQEICPKTFGLSLMKNISTFLKYMLLSETEG